MKSKYIDSKHDIDLIPLKNVDLHAFYRQGVVGFYFFVPGNHTETTPMFIDWEQIDEYLEKLFKLSPAEIEFTEEYDPEQNHTEYIMSGRVSFLWGVLVRFGLWILKRRLTK